MATWFLSAAQEKTIHQSLVAVSQLKPEGDEQKKLVEDAAKLAKKFEDD